MNDNTTHNEARYRGRLRQIPIYLRRNFRLFIYESDWKVLPMAALIAALVVYTVGGNVFVTQEGMLNCAFALSCICIWNGCFNSIQAVCRERDILKREHRAGMHMTSYVAAQMIYQFVICALQSAITITVFWFRKTPFPTEGLFTPWFLVDFWISLILITFASDMMAFAISAIVRSTTSAMTIMPFMLIFQLIFSGAAFSLSGFAGKISKYTISHWGLCAITSQGDYNHLPMVSIWNMMFRYRNELDYMGVKPLNLFVEEVQSEGMLDDFLLRSGAMNTNSTYANTIANVGGCWLSLIACALILAAIALVCLEFIDRDSR